MRQRHHVKSAFTRDRGSTGQVTGFVITRTDGRTVYVTGAASVPFLIDGRFVTLTAAQAARVGELLAPAGIVAVHAEGWNHCTDDRADPRGAFEACGIRDQLRLLERGESLKVTDD